MLEFGILLQNQKLINLIAIASHVVFATKFRISLASLTSKLQFRTLKATSLTASNSQHFNFQFTENRSTKIHSPTLSSKL